MSNKRVCIIGGGVSGLISCKILAEEHFDVVLYEKSGEYGGVWSKTKAYVNLQTNLPWSLYCFSDMPSPKTKEEYATAEQLQNYFDKYVHKHNLLNYMVFQAEVIQATEIEREKWQVTVNIGGKTTVENFDFIVVATGLFETPFIPTFPNSEAFNGSILHASEVKSLDVIQNKRVLIIGSGKSGADIAATCATHASKCVMAFRRAHWMFPRFLFGGRISPRLIYFVRWMRYLIPYHKLDRRDQIIQKILFFPGSLLWKATTFLALREWNYPANSPFIPDFPSGQDEGHGTEPPGFYEAVRTNKIRGEKTEISQFVPHSKIVEFANGKSEEFDVVIFSTGYNIRFPFFDAETIKKLQIPSHKNKDGRRFESPFRLYKGIVPIKGPKTIGFVGFQNTIINSLMYEMQAHWLTEYFLGSFSLPPEKDRETEVEDYLAFEKKMFPYLGGFGCCVYFGLVHCIDDLLKDIKVSSTRTSNFFTEYIMPMYPAKYEISKERALNRTLAKPSARFYFSFSLFLVVMCAFIILFVYLAL